MCDLAQERIQIRRQKLPEALDGLAHKRAVRAARRAERNPNIHGKIVRVKLLCRLDRAPGGIDAEPRPLRRDKIGLPQQPLRVPFTAARHQTLCGQLCRPHAGERTPRRCGGKHLQSGQVITALQNTPRCAHISLFQQHAVRGEAGLSLVCDLCCGRQIAFSPREGGNSPVAGKRLGAELARLLRKQLQLQLLHRVTLGVVFQIQLHSIPSPRRYGLVRSSSSMVLDAPWPGSTRVSGGSLDSRFKDAAMSRLLPPRKSVRP